MLGKNVTFVTRFLLMKPIRLTWVSAMYVSMMAMVTCLLCGRHVSALV